MFWLTFGNFHFCVKIINLNQSIQLTIAFLMFTWESSDCDFHVMRCFDIFIKVVYRQCQWDTLTKEQQTGNVSNSLSFILATREFQAEADIQVFIITEIKSIYVYIYIFFFTDFTRYSMSTFNFLATEKTQVLMTKKPKGSEIRIQPVATSPFKFSIHGTVQWDWLAAAVVSDAISRT